MIGNRLNSSVRSSPCINRNKNEIIDSPNIPHIRNCVCSESQCPSRRHQHLIFTKLSVAALILSAAHLGTLIELFGGIAEKLLSIFR